MTMDIMIIIIVMVMVVLIRDVLSSSGAGGLEVVQRKWQLGFRV